MKRFARAMWWPATLCLSLAALIWHKDLHAGTEAGSTGLRYLCIGEISVDLAGSEPRLSPDEAGFGRSSKPEKVTCRALMAPLAPEALPLAAAGSPSTGLAAALQSTKKDARTAIEEAVTALKKAGWNETGGSTLLRSRNPETTGAVLERRGEWIYVIAAPRLNRGGSFIFAAGRIGIEMRRRI